MPSRFVREMVQQVTRLVSSIPKHDSCLHAVQSPRQMVTGIPLRVPPHLIGQYGQRHRGGTNETAVPKAERSIDCLYIERKDNGSGHWVFNLNTGERNSVNRFTLIPMNQDHINRIDAMGKQEEEQKKYKSKIKFSDYYGNATILDLDIYADPDDKGGSDDYYSQTSEEYDREEEHEEFRDMFEEVVEHG